MDPNSPIYEVKGRIVPERRTSTSTVASVETEKSLQIKPIKPKDGYVTYAPNDAEASARISEPSPQNLSMPVNVNATRGNSNQLHRTASGGSDISNENPAMARPSSLRRVSTVSDQGESEDVLQAAIVQARATKLLVCIIPLPLTIIANIASLSMMTKTPQRLRRVPQLQTTIKTAQATSHTANPIPSSNPDAIHIPKATGNPNSPACNPPLIPLHSQIPTPKP